MFGDPAINPKGWPLKPLGELASKFSDGPFGSNIKSSHYTENGIRVVRLQNIGVGEFLDGDKAYISEEHFIELKKHECLPGDIIVGTLGSPNLRACIQPDWLNVAINKADCVQLRPDERIVNAPYICSLLNQPATEKMAQDLMLGQTRLRISMGRLRGLEVPFPPLSLQQEFARRIESVEKLKTAHKDSLAKLDELFASIQYRAFRGEL
ncbi:restriction endonuclease subunit S [Methanosarcina sp.]|uniref:restriction endonuclease subunit S n=1 Tax=Methanosarcina sp. TaxID=2213 RepID=UPI002ABC540E|nr:restriction endonuclease subunit S [Methanosarcina sp.]MDY9926897.1 restriction endonuclease subunit S [Methanosarcina sp.]